MLNAALWARRAKAVTVALQAGSLRTFTPDGYGKKRPLVAKKRPDNGDDAQGRQRNRRVEIVIQPTKASARQASSPAMRATGTAAVR